MPDPAAEATPLGSTIPLVDLGAQYAGIRAQIDDAMSTVLRRGDFILGRDVSVFETEFAAFVGAEHAVGCGSGTEALHLALRALGIGPGDEVILPAMTFVATALAVTMCGARPVLVDVDPNTALIDPERIPAAINSATRAILPVHLFGQCADMAAIRAIAREHGLWVVEDAAQAHGAICSGRRAGALGDAACFSFYPGKNLGAYGDGGMVTTGSADLARKLRLLGNLGSLEKHRHEVIAGNSRLDTLQAAVLRVKLTHLDAWNEARRAHARRYDEALAGLPRVQRTLCDAGSVYHLYVIRLPDRDRARERLAAAGIGAGIHYPFAVHEQPAFASLGHRSGDFPVAEDWARRCLSLPIYPELPAGVASRVAAVLSS